MGKSRVLWLILFSWVLLLLSPSLCFHSQTRVSRDKRDHSHPCLSSCCNSNISGMSAFVFLGVFFALCYSKNGRFAISSQGWAPGESGMSKGSLRQHPSQLTQSPPQPWMEEPGHGSQHSACTPMRRFCRKHGKLWPFLIFVRLEWTLFRKQAASCSSPVIEAVIQNNRKYDAS